jgi:CrcB protein
MQDSISPDASADSADEEVDKPAVARKRHAPLRPKFRDAAGPYVSVALGSIVGGVGRYLISVLFVSQFGSGFPWATLFVNVAGSFMIGFYAALTGPDGRLLVSPRQRQFVMVGICGGFTTFSAFSLETLRLAQSGNLQAAALNLLISLVGWMTAVWLGHAWATRLNRL